VGQLTRGPLKLHVGPLDVSYWHIAVVISPRDMSLWVSP